MTADQRLSAYIFASAVLLFTPKLVHCSARLRIGCADNRDYTERKKDGANNFSVPAQAETAKNSDRKPSKARSRVLASIPAPRLERGSD